MAVQEALGPDIAVAFDQPVFPSSPRPVVAEATARTHRWAERSLRAHRRPDQALFGVVQGGLDPELRAESTRFIASLPFDGINIGWSRVDGGAAVTTLVEQAQKSFDPAHPENLLPVLAKLRPVMASVAASSQNPLAQLKLQKLDETIADAAGLWVDAVADKGSVVPGGSVKVTLTALARNTVDAAVGQTMILGAKLTGIEGAPTLPIAPLVLTRNKPMEYPATVKFPENTAYTEPYWLAQPKEASKIGRAHV